MSIIYFSEPPSGQFKAALHPLHTLRQAVRTNLLLGDGRSQVTKVLEHASLPALQSIGARLLKQLGGSTPAGLSVCEAWSLLENMLSLEHAIP